MSDGLRDLVVDDVEAYRSVLSNALGVLPSVDYHPNGPERACSL